MKEILTLIEKKKENFARLPLFEYLADSSINPRQRLAFAPCAAPFVMAFGELNKDVFRQETTTDPIQKIINQHTKEEDYHWIWFLEDLEKLGFDVSMKYSDTLKFLWGEETKISRRLAYELYRYTVDTSSLHKLIAIEAEEATADVFLSISSQIVQQLKSTIGNREYRYFGAGHLLAETDHSYCSPQTKQLIENIQVKEEDYQSCFDLVEKIFELFTEFTHELLAYAKAQNVSQISTETEKSDRLLQTV